jgi:hypothetical protein
MPYTQVSICNLALGRVGAKQFISDINEGTVNGQRCIAIWDAIFQEVLSERDWRFAKIRVQLQLSSTTPLYGYSYAYAVPADFLRFVRPRRKPPIRNLLYNTGIYHRQDLPVDPWGYPYVVETLADGNKYLLIDYDNSDTNRLLAINYIRLITDLSQLMPGFVNCLAWRLAEELAISITEDKQKWQGANAAYKEALNSAEAQNECLDFSENESGSTAWIAAGRFAG